MVFNYIFIRLANNSRLLRKIRLEHRGKMRVSGDYKVEERWAIYTFETGKMPMIRLRIYLLDFRYL